MCRILCLILTLTWFVGIEAVCKKCPSNESLLTLPMRTKGPYIQFFLVPFADAPAKDATDCKKGITITRGHYLQISRDLYLGDKPIRILSLCFKVKKARSVTFTFGVCFKSEEILEFKTFREEFPAAKRRAAKRYRRVCADIPRSVNVTHGQCDQLSVHAVRIGFDTPLKWAHSIQVKCVRLRACIQSECASGA